jgi:hypothetical protein
MVQRVPCGHLISNFVITSVFSVENFYLRRKLIKNFLLVVWMPSKLIKKNLFIIICKENVFITKTITRTYQKEKFKVVFAID